MPPSMTPHVDLYNIIRDTRTAIAYAKSHALDSLLDDLERLAQEWSWMPDADADKAPSPEPVDADEFRAMVRPAAPAPVAEPEPEPDEFAVVRAAPAAVEAPPEPPKRPRRRTPPPAAPLPGPVDEAVEGDEGDGFGSIPF